MSKIQDLQAELKALQEKKETEKKIKQLKKQIKAEKFAQTKSGKIFNKIGDFGLAVTKKITTPSPKQTGSKKPQQRVPSVEEVMRRLPQ